MRNRFYLASGWFTPDQLKSMNDVHDLLTRIGVNHYAPYWDGIRLDATAQEPERGKAFRMDLGELHYCKYMIAVIDDFDPGTIWEMGQFFPKPVIAYTSVPQRGLNLMLAESVVAFANSIKNLETLVSNIELLSYSSQYAPNPVWTGEVY